MTTLIFLAFAFALTSSLNLITLLIEVYVYKITITKVEIPSSFALKEENERMKKALQKIANWELPATNQFWDDDKSRPMSY